MSRPTGLKLKVWSSGPRAVVSVYQDRDDADADATTGYRFDDAFYAGAQLPGGTGNSLKQFIELGRLTNSPASGPSFDFEVLGGAAGLLNQYPSLNFSLNDRIELFADAPTAHTEVETPSWHLNNQTGQVRIFHGWIDEISGKGQRLSVSCISAFERANEVVLVRDLANGITVPKIAFNLQRDSAEYWNSYKLVDAGAVLPAEAYLTGAPVDPVNDRGTLRQILEKLEELYADDLQSYGVIPGDQIFDPVDLAALTIKPGPTVFENIGFADAVRQLIQQWTPDRRVVIDPRSGLWRIVHAYAGFGTTSQDLTNQTINTGRTVLWMDDTTAFSGTPGNAGYTIRIVDTLDPTRTEYATVESTLGGNWIWLNELLNFDYMTNGAKVFPMSATIMPTLAVSYDNEVDQDSLEIREDMHACASAVNITSTFEKTETQRLVWDPNDINSPVQPAWNSAFEGAWKHKDADRTIDSGVNGSGIEVYKIDTGGISGRTRIYLPFEQSAYKDDHVADEWQGCALHVLTANNAGVRDQALSFRITLYEVVADIGDGRPGMRISVDTTDLPTAVGGTFDTVLSHAGGHNPDKVGLTSSMTLAGNANNGRSEVGMKFTMTVPHMKQDSSPHQLSCSVPQLYIHDGSGQTRRELALAPNLTYPPLNTRINDSPNSLVYWRNLQTARPATSVQGQPGCDRQGYNPPKQIDVEWETTTDEVRSARFPASGHAGFSHSCYGLVREKEIIAKYWWNDAQDADYAKMAEALWNAWQRVNYRGSATLIGIVDHLAWIDLGIRVGFTTGMWPAGGGSMLNRFWGVLASVTIDFAADRVQFGFDADAPAFWEDSSIQQKTQLVDLVALVRKANELPSCSAGARPAASSPMQCDSTISSGPRNAGVRGRVPTKDNWSGGLGETAVSDSSSPSSASSSHGPNATTTGFRDLAGGQYQVGAGSEVFGGSVAGGVFTPSGAPPPPPMSTAQQAQNSASAALAAWGLSPVLTPPYISSSIVTSANGGDTAFVIAHDELTVDEFVGGQIHVLDYNDENRRPAYDIIANSAGGTIHVATIGEELPAAGVSCTIFRRPAPTADPADFPNGGIVCKDLNNLWCVVDLVAHTVTAGSYDAGTNTVGIEVGDIVSLQSGFASRSNPPSVIGATFHNGTNPIDDDTNIDVVVPFGFTITAVRIVSNATGDAKVDILAQDFSGFNPASFTSICGTVPEIAAGDVFEDTTLAGYTTTFPANTVIRFIVSDITDIASLSITLEVQKEA